MDLEQHGASGSSCGTALHQPGPQLPARPATPASDAAREALDGLVVDALRYRQSAEFARLLHFVRGFRSYKPFNALLVDVQKPGSTFVASASRWRRRYGRRLRVGAQPLVVLQPFGPVMFVYDVSDTEPEPDAPPLPLEVTEPFAVLTPATPAAVHAALLKLVDGAKRDGVRVVDVPFGTQLAGRIGVSRSGHAQQFQVARRPQAVCVDVPVRVDLEVDARQAGSTRYATLAHELGHLYCGHLGTPHERWWPDRRSVDPVAAEFEAEVVAALALGRLDPAAVLPPHLAQHLSSEQLVPQGLDLERVLHAAGLVIEMSTSTMRPRQPSPALAPDRR